MVNRSMLQWTARGLKSEVGLCWLACLPAILIFMAVSLYNHPIGDDFWCTSMVQKYGYWNAQARLYNTVPPRYLELAISCLTPLSFGNFSGYKVIPILFILLSIHVLAGLYRTLGGRGQLSYRRAILPAILFVTLYLSVMPGIAEGIYWTSALMVYHTGMILFIVWCDYSLRWYYLQRRTGYLIVASLCLAGMLGCNEIISIVVVLVMAVIAVHRLWRGKRGGIDAMLATQFIVLISCLLFILQFKGTGNRYSLVKTDASGRWLYSIGYSFVIDGYYIGKCLINPFFWALSIVWYRYCRKWVALIFQGRFDLFEFRLSYLVTWATILIVIPFVIVFITGDRPPLRICNMIVFFFLLGLTGPAVWLSPKIKEWKYAAVAVVVLVVSGFLLRNNVSLGARDLFSGDAARYDQAWNSRYEMIRRCKEDSCEVPRLGKIPFVFLFEPDITEPHISEYFGKQILVK